MNIVEIFNEMVERERNKLPHDQEASMEASMEQFDELIRSGVVQPERYKIEPVSTLTFRSTNSLHC